MYCIHFPTDPISINPSYIQTPCQCQCQSQSHLTLEFSRHIVWKPSHIGKVHLHSLETQINSSLDIINHNSLWHIAPKLGCIQFIIGSSSLDYLRLFLDSKVLVSVGRINVLLVKVQTFIVRNYTRIGKVVETTKVSLGHGKGCGKHLGKDSHGIGDVDNTFILGNLGDEITVDQIIRDGHAHTEDEGVGEALEHFLHVSLGLTVETLVKVGLGFFDQTNSVSKGMGLIVFENASGGVDGVVDASFVGDIGNIEGSNDVGTDGFGLVVLAPVNVGAAGDSCCHQYVGGLDLVELLGQTLTVFNTGISKEHLNSF